MPSVPVGICQCGRCGQKTKIAVKTVYRGGKLKAVKGEPLLYVYGHRPVKAARYVEKDQGYTTPCWVWLLSVDESGYARQSAPGRTKVPMHVFNYEQKHGPMPEGMVPDHLCHNPKTCAGGITCSHRRCINPDHIEPVTRATNSQRGSTAKLTPEDIPEIKRLRDTGLSYSCIAKRFGVTKRSIINVIKGLTWVGI